MNGEALVLSHNDATTSLLMEALSELSLRARQIEGSAVERTRGATVLIADLSNFVDKGLEAIHNFRLAHPDSVILALGGEGSVIATAALDEGADVHLPAVARATQVTAQLRAIFRRTSRGVQESIKVGLLELDMNQRTATARGRDLRLTAGEYKVLAFLAENVGRVVSHTDIYYAMHQETITNGDSREPVKVLISRLRQKLKEATLTSPSIRTVRGFGYVLDRRAARETRGEE